MVCCVICHNEEALCNVCVFQHAINSYTDYRNGPSTHHDAIDIYSRSPSNDRPPPILLKASHRNDELSEPLRSPGKSSTPGIPSLLSAGEGPPAPSPTSYTIQKPVPNSVHARVVGEGRLHFSLMCFAQSSWFI